MAPSYFQGVTIVGKDHMQVSLFFLLLSVDTLQNYIGLVRFLDGDHVQYLSPRHGDTLGKGGLTNLTLEFGEIVGNYYSV